jgi:hypothetical protein
MSRLSRVTNQHRDVTVGRDSDSCSTLTGRNRHGLGESGGRCVTCQVGQGDDCACRDAQLKAKRKPSRSFWDMSATTFWRGYVLGLLLCWVAGYWSAS